MSKQEKMTGIEEMRAAVKLFDQCRESFNEQWSTHSLVNIYRAYMACTWDVYPDQWTEYQLSYASCLGADGAPKFRYMTEQDEEMYIAGRLDLCDGLLPLSRRGELDARVEV